MVPVDEMVLPAFLNTTSMEPVSPLMVREDEVLKSFQRPRWLILKAIFCESILRDPSVRKLL